MNNIQTEIQKLSPSAIIDVFSLDLGKQGGPTLFFHAGTNELSDDLVWQGITYNRYPIQVSGFEMRNNGTLPRPIVKVSNIQGILGSLARQYGYFLGCKFTRKRTFARFLDAVNFAQGNPNADPNQHMNDEVWFVDRKAVEDANVIEFELASSLDLAGVGLPRRQFVQNTCAWVYRSSECGYSGPPVSDSAGNPTSDPQKDKCGRRLSDCKARYGSGVLPFGGFPGVGLVRT